jgi:hypothetical protein
MTVVAVVVVVVVAVGVRFLRVAGPKSLVADQAPRAHTSLARLFLWAGNLPQAASVHMAGEMCM